MKPEQIQRKAVRQMVLDLHDICKSYLQGKEPVPVLHDSCADHAGIPRPFDKHVRKNYVLDIDA